MIDTDMQALIRETPKERFPMVERFQEMKRQNAFRTSEEIARDILALAFDDPARGDVLLDLRG